MSVEEPDFSSGKPQLWGWDTGAIIYGVGNGKTDKVIQDYPELFQLLKDACKQYFDAKEDTK
jgi:hypothetical protein